MNVYVTAENIGGTISATSSKSAAHRALICAAFADGDTVIRCNNTNDDIDATADCLRALGASVRYEYPSFFVSPISKVPSSCRLLCGESGSTLRFLLPVICTLGTDAQIHMRGRLSERPLSPLYEILQQNGIALSPAGSNPLTCSGKLNCNTYEISAQVSSQFISGLLFSLAISGGGQIKTTGVVNSEPYIQMTVDTLSDFGVRVIKDGPVYTVEKSTIHSPGYISVEGDWSSAAFPLCMGALTEVGVGVSGLSINSSQGDKKILDILKCFGAKVQISNREIRVARGELYGIETDASQIPDLVPVIATVAAVANGTTIIRGAARLRFKESDRLVSTQNMLNALGV